MITTIARFRPRRGTNEITNFPRKAFFWGKVSRPLRSRHSLEDQKRKKTHRKSEEGMKKVLGNGEAKKTKESWKTARWS
jgi:ribosomal protein L15